MKANSCLFYSATYTSTHSSVWHTQNTLSQYVLSESTEICNSVCWRILLGHCLKSWKLGSCQKESRGIRGMLLNYTGHTHPCSPYSLLSAFSSGFKQSFPFSESLSHSYILYVWNHLQTFHNVRVWGKNRYIGKAFHQIEAFCDLFNQKGQNDPFLKRLVLPTNKRIAKYNKYYTLRNGVCCLAGGKLSIYWFWVSNISHKLLHRFKDEGKYSWIKNLLRFQMDGL